MKALLLSLSCPLLVFLGVVLIGIRPGARQAAGYFCIYLAGIVVMLAGRGVKESEHAERNEG